MRAHTRASPHDGQVRDGALSGHRSSSQVYSARYPSLDLNGSTVCLQQALLLDGERAFIRHGLKAPYLRSRHIAQRPLASVFPSISRDDSP